jgi:quinol monooxygenase YgiN
MAIGHRVPIEGQGYAPTSWRHTLVVLVVGGGMAVTYFVRMRAREGQADAVRELLLSNVERIRSGEPGNVVFAVHRSLDDANEFWLYETWTGLEAVEAHESGPSFREYKEALRPLVEPDSLVFGNTEPVVALGYGLPAEGA